MVAVLDPVIEDLSEVFLVIGGRILAQHFLCRLGFLLIQSLNGIVIANELMIKVSELMGCGIVHLDIDALIHVGTATGTIHANPITKGIDVCAIDVIAPTTGIEFVENGFGDLLDLQQEVIQIHVVSIDDIHDLQKVRCCNTQLLCLHQIDQVDCFPTAEQIQGIGTLTT